MNSMISLGADHYPHNGCKQKGHRFGGRAIEKEGYPKYINSPESSIFSKGSSLFGIDKTKGHIVEKDEAIVVEGYFDSSLFTRKA